MQLTVQYNDGSTRVVNLHQEFFKNTEVKDRYKTITVTPEQKAMDFALSNGSNPYSILLMEGTEIVFKQINKANKPQTKKLEKPTHEWMGFMTSDGGVSEKEKKALKKENFTKSWTPSKEQMSWKQGIELLLSHIK